MNTIFSPWASEAELDEPTRTRKHVIRELAAVRREQLRQGNARIAHLAMRDALKCPRRLGSATANGSCTPAPPRV